MTSAAITDDNDNNNNDSIKHVLHRLQLQHTGQDLVDKMYDEAFLKKVESLVEEVRAKEMR